MEKASPDRQAFTASFALVGAGVGVLAGSGMANLLTLFLTKAEILAWGWRLPFLFGVVLAIIGLYIRTKIWRADDAQISITKTIPLLQLFKNHKLSLLKAFCFLSICGVISGMLVIFLVTYLTHYLLIPLSIAFKLLFLSTLIMIIGLPVSAWIADYFKVHRKWLLIGLVLFFIATYPLFILMHNGVRGCVIAVLLLNIIYCFSFGPFAPVLINMFPKNVRYSGVAIMHGLAFSLIGGTAPLVLNGLVLKFGSMAPSYYIMGFTLIAFITVYTTKNLHT